MHRRTFLSVAGGVAGFALGLNALLPRRAQAALDRASFWKPNAKPLLAIEWRYLVARITDAGQDIGFIVSISDIRYRDTTELLVERQELPTGSFASRVYTGELVYDDASLTYRFTSAEGATLATWQWDVAAGVYRLQVATDELTLTDLVLAPQGDLIPEGGDGEIDGGEVSGVGIDSNYHADWVEVRSGGVAKGFGRLDMQGLRPRGLPTTPTPADDFDHHWFALAGSAAGGPVWISAWRIEQSGSPIWGVTVARGSGVSWSVTSYTEASASATPLLVRPLLLQPLDPILQDSTGAAWRLTAGITQPGDLLDLVVKVPAGQIIRSGRQSSIAPSMLQEAVGFQASGTVQGQPIEDVLLVVAESTLELNGSFLPLLS